MQKDGSISDLMATLESLADPHSPIALALQEAGLDPTAAAKTAYELRQHISSGTRTENDYSVSRRQYAERLGVHVETIGRWEREGKIAPGRKIGGAKHFRESDVLKAYAEFGPRPIGDYTVSRADAARRLKCSPGTISRRFRGRKRGTEVFYSARDVAREELFRRNSELVGEFEFRRMLGDINAEQFAWIKQWLLESYCSEDRRMPLIAKRSRKLGDVWFRLEAERWSHRFLGDPTAFLDSSRHRQFVECGKVNRFLARDISRQDQAREKEARNAKRMGSLYEDDVKL
jgi:hypothetical protein